MGRGNPSTKFLGKLLCLHPHPSSLEQKSLANLMKEGKIWSMWLRLSLELEIENKDLLFKVW